MNQKSSKALRIIAIVFMGLTAAMNLLGGAGTVCAAFLTKQYPPMWDLMDYQWLYQLLMITTIITGIFGVWSTVKLVKGGKSVYMIALIILIVGTVLGFTQYYASLTIRGKAVPANMKFYANLLTLILFIILKLPGVREKVDFSQPGGAADKTAGGMAAIVSGLLALTVFKWVGASHTYLGESWVDLFANAVIFFGLSMVAIGVSVLTRVAVGKIRETPKALVLETPKR